MKVRIEQRAGDDYPLRYKDNPAFREAQEEMIRKRLELRPTDIVEIIEV